MGNVRSSAVQGSEKSSRRGRRSTTMDGMPLNDMPWWRWRVNVRSALHMLSDPVFQRECWLTGRPGYGDVTDAVYRLVEDTWLDNWSAEKYIGTIFRDPAEANLVDVAVLRVLRIMHQVGADAPVSAYLEHHAWPEAVRAAREAHVRLAANDGDEADVPPRPLDVLAQLTRIA
ncbi:SCO4402 family protein [Streptomyces syringium]|uniref:SCO4402 family protein n=1 Tax=Streptomyces syringium TaxID=76729 RepID=UPI0033EA453A